MKRRIYVFVVVGRKEHIDELNLSIRALKNFTPNEILVVTDLSRNESGIEHGNVLDVRTPGSMTNHQAAIYLKTGLHRVLDMSHDYCYLDGDVLAIREAVDKIFDHFVPPVTFCTDHCKLPQFSEAAIHTTVDPDIIRKRERLNALFDIINKNNKKNKPGFKTHYDRCIQFILFRIAILIATIEIWINGWKKNLKTDDVRKIKKSVCNTRIRSTYVRLNEKIFRNPTHPLYFFMREGYFHDKNNYRWIDAQGNVILVESSDKLAEEILNKFEVEVTDKNWQHWNGGVFLFNAESNEFMEQWHQWTLAIFDDPNWQTRDQGTLVATAWQFGLEKHSTLPIEFNFLADYHHPTMKYLGDLTFGFKDSKVKYEPIFLHIYHHWGDQEWPIWKDVAHLVSIMAKES